MTEYGLSVSLDVSPRESPRSPEGPRSSSFTPTTTNDYHCVGAPRKIMKFADICCENDHSISPRILCPPSVAENVRRRLDLSFSDLMDELSPVTLSGGGAAIVPQVARIDVCDDDCDCASCSIGECGVCYANLPLRKNHVFTLCGHLYCLRCLLKWWDTSSTCPICRAELFDVGPGPGAGAVGLQSSDADTDSDTDADTDADTSSVQDPDTTLMEQYLQQDPSAMWSILRLGNTDMIFDDLVIPLSQYELTELRSNREIATSLLARTNELFTGRAAAAVVHRHILQENWVEYFTHDNPRMLSDSDNNEIMYEFVIRKQTEISPLYETSLFGTIQDITIVLVEDAQGRDSDVYDWENLHEYAFVAHVFTATPIRIYEPIINGGDNHSSSLRRYGDYDMNDGTVRPTRVLIRFSQIRRLYRIECQLEED